MIQHVFTEASKSAANGAASMITSVEGLLRVPATVHRLATSMTELHRSNVSDFSDSSKSLFKWVMLQMEESLYQLNLTTEWTMHPQGDAKSLGGGSMSNHYKEKGMVKEKEKGREKGKESKKSRRKTRETEAFEVDEAMVDPEPPSPNTPDMGHILVAAHHPGGFFQLWSTLSFLFSMVEGTDDLYEEELLSNEAEFGHGFSVAGCLFLHLLGQKSSLELYDFSKCVFKADDYAQLVRHVGDSEKKVAGKGGVGDEGGVGGIDSRSPSKPLTTAAAAFLESYKDQQRLEGELFALFEAQHEPRKSYIGASVGRLSFHPPKESPTDLL